MKIFLNICERLNGKPFKEPGGLVQGVIVQFGGQTPLNLGARVERGGRAYPWDDG